MTCQAVIIKCVEKIFMINRVNSNSINSTAIPVKRQPQFAGILDSTILAGIQACERAPMINVAVLDLSTAIIPRTIIEGETNPYAGFEAFRRESSGLIVNCMIPGLIVAAIAKGIQKPIMGAGSNMASCWANEDTIKLVKEHWNKNLTADVKENGKVLYAGDKARVYNTIKDILDNTKGVDGEELKDFSKLDFHENIKTLTESAFKEKLKKTDKISLKNAYKEIAEKIHATENLKIDGSDKYFSQNLESIVDNMPKLLKEIIGGKAGDATTFAQKATKLLNRKSAIGLFGAVIPLALSMQPINRWITEKSSGKKGAPIYKDFAENGNRELSKKEKSDLFKQKIISVGSMLGVMFLSMGFKLPKMPVLQFKGIFPTMDQARLISTATFSSRMMASQDKNDLREATFRDIATFSSFYFLGDHVAKGTAGIIQKASKNKIKLINNLKELKPNANTWDKIVHWTKNTALKSSHEVVGPAATRWRSVCQLSNIVFSLIALGLVIPKMYRSKTNKKREAELKSMGVDQNTIDKYYKHLVAHHPAFAANINSQENLSNTK